MASRPTRQRIRVDHLARKCESMKVSFATRDEALAACEQQMDAGRVSPGCHITPYRCERCGLWHMANKQIVFTEAPEDLARHDPRAGMRRPAR